MNKIQKLIKEMGDAPPITPAKREIKRMFYLNIVDYDYTKMCEVKQVIKVQKPIYKLKNFEDWFQHEI